MKKIIILGSTGSVGTQTFDVAKKRGADVLGISFNKNVKLAEEQARELKVKYAVTPDEQAATELKIKLADTETIVKCGNDEIVSLASLPCDKVFNSITGCAGLDATLSAIRAGNMLALANKESLVSAGKLVSDEAKSCGVEILPVDSEHTAIHECMRAGNRCEVKKILLTASGGPFFGYDAQKLDGVTPEMALKHPNWSMGAKITIDSATLINKAFEVVEASYLYGIEYDRIEVLVHRESIIHSMVEYIDNSVIAQMSVPDMRHCAEYALDFPNRCDAVINELDLTKLTSLSFAKPDSKTFPMLDLGYEILKRGQGFGACVNSANETAVMRFLKRELAFTDIYRAVMYATEKLEGTFKCADDIEAINSILHDAHRYADEYVSAVI